MGGVPMSLGRDDSFASHPKSDRYWKMLNGSSAASVRVDQGLAGAASAANKFAKAVKARRGLAKERKATQQGIESGEIRDLS